MTEQENNGIEVEAAQDATAENDAEATQATLDEHTAKLARRKKRGIVAGVIVAVAVVAGASFWVWHEQPSFCNAICHSPMDYYVETYYEGDEGMLITAHAEAGETCLSCHEAVLTTQISEVMSWIADDYPMTEDGTMLATGAEFATEEFCTSSGCHSMTEVVANTWGFADNDEEYNPHSSHQSNNLECGDCHKVHETSELYCAKCHDLNLPEGWEATGE